MGQCPSLSIGGAEERSWVMVQGAMTAGVRAAARVKCAPYAFSHTGSRGDEGASRGRRLVRESAGTNTGRCQRSVVMLATLTALPAPFSGDNAGAHLLISLACEQV